MTLGRDVPPRDRVTVLVSGKEEICNPEVVSPLGPGPQKGPLSRPPVRVGVGP